MLVTHSPPDELFIEKIRDLWSQGYLVYWMNGGGWAWSADMKSRYDAEYERMMDGGFYWDGARTKGDDGRSIVKRVANSIGHDCSKGEVKDLNIFMLPAMQHLYYTIVNTTVALNSC